jgi:hypothetical protein
MRASFVLQTPSFSFAFTSLARGQALAADGFRAFPPYTVGNLDQLPTTTYKMKKAGMAPPIRGQFQLRIDLKPTKHQIKSVPGRGLRSGFVD